MYNNSSNKIKNTESNINSIEKKLNSPDTTLEDLLIEDDLLSEIRNQNQKLIEFFDKDKIKSLVNYIIKEPKEDNELIGHKFPFVASEILNSEEDKFLFYFLNTKSEQNNINSKSGDITLKLNDNGNENKKAINKKITYQIKERNPNNIIEMLDYFFSFLETKKELNYVLAGYFSKFFHTLLSRKPKKIINYLYQERKDIIKQIVFHCYNKSICDLLIKILNFDNIMPSMSSSLSINFNGENHNNFFGNLNIEFLITARSEILTHIFTLLKINEKTEKISSITLMLIELFENKIILDEVMNNKRVFNLIFKELKIDLNSEININNSKIKTNYSELLTLLIYMISNYKNHYVPKIDLSNEEDMVEIGSVSNRKIIHTSFSENFFSSFNFLMNNFTQNKETLNKLISIPTCYNNINIKPLGSFRIKIIELFACCFGYFKNISYKYDEILISNNFFPIAFDYLFKYEWNNFYQLALLRLFKNYLKESNYHIILSIYLFEKFNIIGLIKEHIIPKEDLPNKFIFSSKKNYCNHGYISFLISLCYKINAAFEGFPLKFSSEDINISLNKSNGKNSDRYNSYDSNLAESNEIKFFGKNNISESLFKYNSDNWKEFFKTYIKDTIKLYESKLLFKSNNNEDINFFLKKRSIENNNNYNNEVWDDNNYHLNTDNEIDISDFIFQDETKNSEKEDDIILNKNSLELKVDELDEDKQDKKE